MFEGANVRPRATAPFLRRNAPFFIDRVDLNVFVSEVRFGPHAH